MRYEIEIEIKEVRLGDGRDGVVFRFADWQIDRVGMKRKLLSGLPESAIPAQRQALANIMRDLSCMILDHDPRARLKDLRGGDFAIFGVASSDNAIISFAKAARSLKNISVRFE